MKKQFDKTEINSEQQKVDEHIIIANITVIAAFILILSVNDLGSLYVKITAILSLLFLIISLFMLLWNKYRFPIRQVLFSRDKEELLSGVSEKIADFAEKLVIPHYKNEMFKKVSSDQHSVKKDIIEDMIVKDTIITYLENLNFKTTLSEERIFNLPLNEDYRILNNWLDKICRFYRYIFFVSGVLLFFVTLVVGILQVK